MLQNALTITGRKPIADLAIRNRLSTVWADSGLMDTGGLMSYGPNVSDLFRRAATYVDLKGVKPSDLPVEQPTKFEFVINLKAAKQIGLTIPKGSAQRATFTASNELRLYAPDFTLDTKMTLSDHYEVTQTSAASRRRDS